MQKNESSLQHKTEQPVMENTEQAAQNEEADQQVEKSSEYWLAIYGEKAVKFKTFLNSLQLLIGSYAPFNRTFTPKKAIG